MSGLFSDCCNAVPVPQPKEGEGVYICQECQKHCKLAQTGPKNINWVEARIYYLNDATRTYKDVSTKYGVSLRSVEDMGSREKWVEIRRKLGEDALVRFEENKKSLIAEASDRHIKFWRNIQGRVLQQLQKTEAVDGKSVMVEFTPVEISALTISIKRAIDGERVVLGLPTSVAKQELSGGLNLGTPLTSEEIDEMEKFQDAENKGHDKGIRV